MRQGCVLLMGLFFGGCILEGPTTGWLGRPRLLQGPTGSDVIQLDVAILEAVTALGGAQDTESAAARHWRLEGVALLARTLVKVATPEAMPEVEQIGHLKGNV